jgi:hypothetical protein
MVVVHPEPIKAEGSYDVPLQPVGPFMVLEYVSNSSKRKDYEDNMDKYERQLKVPYYLLFYPDTQDLSLYHHTGKKYVSVKPNDQERYAIPELDLEVALLDGWARFWYKGRLLPLPADLQRELDATRRQLEEERRQRAETGRLLEEERRQRAEASRQLEEEQRQRADERRQLDEAQQARWVAEDELARLRSQLEELKRPKKNHK